MGYHRRCRIFTRAADGAHMPRRAPLRTYGFMRADALLLRQRPRDADVSRAMRAFAPREYACQYARCVQHALFGARVATRDATVRVRHDAMMARRAESER